MIDGTVIIPDRSNTAKSLKIPKDCHCHCAIVVTGAVDEDRLQLITEEHRHYGLGGWWKNEDCLICKI